MNKDLNINNYNFHELLNLYKIQQINTITLEQIKQKNIKIKEKYSIDIYIFYNKIYKILEVIHCLIKENSQLSNDYDLINDYINQIREIDYFENYDCKNIIVLLNKFNDENLIIKPILNPVVNNTIDTNKIVNNYNNTTAPGNLNSLKRITQTLNLNINSCFRHNYYTCSSTNFQYLLSSEIKNIISIRLASIEIPNSWYLFTHKQKNNIFDITIRVDDNTSVYTIIIPDGNYDNETLETFLNTTYFCDSCLDSSLKHIRFTVDKFNFKSRFEVINIEEYTHFSYSLSFLHNDNLMNTAGWILGFRLPKYENIMDNLQSEALFDAGGDRYIYFSLIDYQKNTNITNIIEFDRSSMYEDILAKIPMINGKLSLIIDDNNNPLVKKRVYNGPVNLRKISIKILDKFGNIIDLNNMDFSFTLEMEILYENFNFNDITT
jgi:hypothetical protein